MIGSMADDIEILRAEIDHVQNAGNQMMEILMKLHPRFHDSKCETCKALGDWWSANGR